MPTVQGIWWRSRFHLWGESDGALISPTELQTLIAETSRDALLALSARKTTLRLRSGLDKQTGSGLSPERRGEAAAGKRSPEPTKDYASPMPPSRRNREGRNIAEPNETSVTTLSFSPAETIDLFTTAQNAWIKTSPTPEPTAVQSDRPADQNSSRTTDRSLATEPAASPPEAPQTVQPQDGIRRAEPGETLLYWGQLARLVVRLLARRQWAPDVKQEPDGRFVALWRPFILNRDLLSWLERYAALMPSVCRSVVPDGGGDVDPIRLVEGFMAETSDAVVRRVLSADPFFRQMKGRAARAPEPGLRWLSSLMSEQGRMRGRREDNEAVAAQIHAWLSRLEEPSEPPPEIRFALIEPPDEDAAVPALHADDASSRLANDASTPPPDDVPAPPAEPAWRLQIQIRSAVDGRPLDAAAFWAESRYDSTFLGKHLINRREQLLAELTRAARVVPELRPVLTSGGCSEVSLTTQAAHAFIYQHAPQLAAGGFKVVLPDWATGEASPLGLCLHVEPAGDASGQTPDGVSVGSIGLNTLLNFDWRIAVGDENISVEEFERIAASKAPLAKVRGRWTHLDAQAAQAAVRFLQGRRRDRLTLLEAIRLVGGVEELETGLPIVGLNGASWLDDLLSQNATKTLEAVSQPADFRGLLRPYQLRGLNWLALLDRLGIGACLADDMGLGKTIQFLALLLHERQDGNPVGPTLLFSPMSVVSNWHREANRFAPSLRVLVHHGPDRPLGEAFAKAAADHDLVVTTYGLAHRDFKDLSRIAWHRIAMDEAQKIKNPNAVQSAAIRNMGGARRVALTGTPVENHLSELWSIMETLNHGLLGSAAAFRRRFAIPIEKLGDDLCAERLRRMIRPFILRRLKTDPTVECDLPDKMEMRVYCNLTPEQAAHYARLVEELLSEVDRSSGIRRRGLILATITRLKQVCNHPEQLLRAKGPLDRRSGKCERLVEMLEEVLDEGDAALVFTQYREMGLLLERLLCERLRTDLLFMHGATPAKKRDEQIDRFQDPDSPTRIFILSLKTGGFGLNLTRANHVFHFDRWWNPAVEEQATSRAHRIGQSRRVQVHKFVCIGTIEDRIDQVLSEKSALADRIIGSGDDWLTSLSTRELRDYLTLSPEAVAEV